MTSGQRALERNLDVFCELLSVNIQCMMAITNPYMFKRLVDPKRELYWYIDRENTKRFHDRMLVFEDSDESGHGGWSTPESDPALDDASWS